MRFQKLLDLLTGRGVQTSKKVQRALLIIDMQKCFLDEHRPEEVALMISAQITLIRECKKQNVPIVVIEYAEDGNTIPELQIELLGYGNLHFVIKKNNDAFLGTGLRSALIEFGVEEIILAGVNASYCVLETARTAVKCNFRICTSEKLISDSPHNKRNDRSLWWYRENGELVLDLPQVA